MIRSFAQLCWDAEALWVHLWTDELEVRAEEAGPLGIPCEDSCLELFFSPMEGDSRYFNFEYNANSCLYLGIGSCFDDLTRLVPEDAEALFAPAVNRLERGWEIFYQVPFAFIRRFFPAFEAKPGKTMRANCFKCADLSTPPHYLSWNPVVGEPFTFHRPDCFGIMRFTE